MQTILGAGGAIGLALAKALPAFTKEKIRHVSRGNNLTLTENEEWLPADLTQKEQVMSAVEGSSVVYLTAGLLYNLKVWQEQWPLVMRNTLDACKTHGARLVFFDNIYMYDGSNLNPITEDLPINPMSKKGKVRATIAQMLMEAVEKGEVEALIARAADFYGPSLKTSMLTETVVKPLSGGKTANWMGNPDLLHSFTYTPDAGKATALLGNSTEAYGDVWHLPTAAPPLTGRQWVEAFANELGVPPKFRSVGKNMVRLMGLFVPIMRELLEMMYQNDRDYVFNSNKFEKKFGMKPTPYAEGIKEIVRRDYSK
jgi:nucleoside-diphosphate-sugar epimerase